MEDIEPRTIFMSLSLAVFSLAALDVLFVAPSPLGADVTPEEEVSPEPSEPAVSAEPDVLSAITEHEFAAQEIAEFTFLGQIIPPQEALVETHVLLKDGDRAGSITWVDTPRVRVYYFALKEALHTSFTADLADLQDETQSHEDTTRNLLAFHDPGISEERIIFIRIRERFYEVHAAAGHEAELMALLDDLTGWPEAEAESLPEDAS